MQPMVRRGTKPNRNVEESLHHGPVTGMLDPVLLNEMRNFRTRGTDREDITAPERIAMQVSWELHALLAFRIPRL